MDKCTEDKQFILKFIENYQCSPALWNLKVEAYCNREEKAKQYEILLEIYKERHPSTTVEDRGKPAQSSTPEEMRLEDVNRMAHLYYRRFLQLNGDLNWGDQMRLRTAVENRAAAFARAQSEVRQQPMRPPQQIRQNNNNGPKQRRRPPTPPPATTETPPRDEPLYTVSSEEYWARTLAILKVLPSSAYESSSVTAND